jgi:23S rRNA (uracil1939-C5)-methyltransferase
VPLTPDTDIELAIEKPVTGGRMLARHEGRVVLVAGAIPGERVRARIEKVSGSVVFASTIAVMQPSGDRRAGPCDWACGGSLYAHITYERQLELKSELVVDAFARIGKLPLPQPVPVSASKETGYRTRARLHARDGRFGFFREGTHQLCDAGPTGQLSGESLEALARLERGLAAANVRVEACELAENRSGTERAALLELARGEQAPLGLANVEGLTGVVFAEQEMSRLSLGYGSPFVHDVFSFHTGDVELIHHVQSFFQGNRFLCEALARRVVEQIADDGIIDLYAGVGLFALSAAAEGRLAIVAVEGDRSSARDLEENAGRFSGAVTVERSSVERYLEGNVAARVSTLVLDPPRTGMSREAMAGILKLKPPRVVYVSCDLATVARDVRRLIDAGYSMVHIEAFDLFPNTGQLESVVVLQK